MATDDELLDLVDRDDNVIGTINRMDYDRMVAENLGYIRSSQFFLLNQQGQIYIPIRTAHKTIAPNGFDYTAGGHIGAGDDYVNGMIREAEEELGMELSSEDLELVAKTLEEDIRYYNALYIVHGDETPTLNPHDFVSGEWMTPDEVIAKIDAGHPTKTSLKHSVQLLQDYLRQQ